MPYITPEAKEALLSRPPKTVGELNYAIHMELFREYIDEKAIAAIIDTYIKGKEVNYDLYNSVMGVLECVYWEFDYRRPRKPNLYHVADGIKNLQRWFYNTYLLPYETQKRKENGDVYDSTANQ